MKWQKGRNAAARTLLCPPGNPLHHTSRPCVFWKEETQRPERYHSPPKTPFTTHQRAERYYSPPKPPSPHLTSVCLLRGRNAAARTLLCASKKNLHHTSRPCVFWKEETQRRERYYASPLTPFTTHHVRVSSERTRRSGQNEIFGCWNVLFGCWLGCFLVADSDSLWLGSFSCWILVADSVFLTCWLGLS